jgi:hypothetical protein
MSAAGPSQGARPPLGGGDAARAASLGGVLICAAGPSQGARPLRQEQVAVTWNQMSLGGAAR